MQWHLLHRALHETSSLLPCRLGISTYRTRFGVIRAPPASPERVFRGSSHGALASVTSGAATVTMWIDAAQPLLQCRRFNQPGCSGATDAPTRSTTEVLVGLMVVIGGNRSSTDTLLVYCRRLRRTRCPRQLNKGRSRQSKLRPGRRIVVSTEQPDGLLYPGLVVTRSVAVNRGRDCGLVHLRWLATQDGLSEWTTDAFKLYCPLIT
jgi:hypothetical protein